VAADPTPTDRVLPSSSKTVSTYALDDHRLLTAARRGDEVAFAEMIEPLRRALLVHCYRMLGSLEDAEDAFQETLVRAWRHLGAYEPNGPLRNWVYRIATNVCLNTLARRRTPVRGEGATAYAGLEPLPDHLIDDGDEDPAAIAERRESVDLAFMAAVQILPPRQRAVLLLRDVLDWSAREVAAALETTPAAVNSALARARGTLAHERAGSRLTRTHQPLPTSQEQTLARRFAAAWHRADLDGLIEMLTADALLTMPPQPLRVEGAEAIATFLRDVASGGRLERFRLVPTRANRQPALALYRDDTDRGDRHVAYTVLVLALAGGRIASLVRFGGGDAFRAFGLPATLSSPLAV